MSEAIGWWVKLQSGVASEQERLSCQAWLAQDATHRDAWERLGHIATDARRVPSSLAHIALTDTQHVAMRRTVLRSFLGLAGVITLGWAGYRHAPWQRVMADLSTGVGERRKVSLGGGLSLTLNSDSAIRVRVTATARAVDLLRGELLVDQADIPNSLPLRVDTGYGTLSTEHARFDTHRGARGARVSVYAGSVTLIRSDGMTAGSQGEGLRFREQGQIHRFASDPDRLAWTDGMVVAKNQRLADFARQLQRHRHGVVQVDPSVADLRLSGVFPIDDAPRALNALARTLPISVESRTPFWLYVGPREA